MTPPPPSQITSTHARLEQAQKLGWVLLTGASFGIGKELAHCFAKAGFSLFLTARDGVKLGALASELKTLYGTSTQVHVEDLSEPGAADRVWQAAADLPIDVLVNNAGFGQQGLFDGISDDTVRRMIQLNVTTLAELTHRALPTLRVRRGGRILQVASTAAFQPGPRMALYYATKAFVLSFSEALDEELQGSGISVTTLCPGPTATEFAARAGMKRVRLFQGPLARFMIQDAASVAEAGFIGCMRGKRLVSPGVFNQIGVLTTRLFPRRWVTRVAGYLQSQKVEPAS